MKRRVFVGAASLLAGAWIAASGCGGGELAVLQNDRENSAQGDSGEDSDSGGDVVCGARACDRGELCCPGSDLACTPTCTRADSCPVLGRPCPVGTGTTLSWYWTCREPVCPTVADAGPAPSCPAAGSACADKGATCGTRATSTKCGAILVCDDHDPTTGGCPVSSKKFKEDVVYVGPGELQRLHDETLTMRLATYRYRGVHSDPRDPRATHLGFIIEDQPASLAVDRGHDRVDLYGTMSMAIATLQVQEKEIRALRRDLDQLRAACDQALTDNRGR